MRNAPDGPPSALLRQSLVSLERFSWCRMSYQSYTDRRPPPPNTPPPSPHPTHTLLLLIRYLCGQHVPLCSIVKVVV